MSAAGWTQNSQVRTRAWTLAWVSAPTPASAAASSAPPAPSASSTSRRRSGIDWARATSSRRMAWWSRSGPHAGRAPRTAQPGRSTWCPIGRIRACGCPSWTRRPVSAAGPASMPVRCGPTRPSMWMGSGSRGWRRPPGGRPQDGRGGLSVLMGVESPAPPGTGQGSSPARRSRPPRAHPAPGMHPIDMEPTWLVVPGLRHQSPLAQEPEGRDEVPPCHPR